MPRQPKTTAEHKRNGTYREDRHGNRVESKFIDGTPANIDEELGGFGQTVRALVLASVPADALTPLDGVTLDAACLLYEQWRDCVRDPESPSVDKVRLFNSWTSLLAKFGATPADRCKLKIVAETEDTGDALESLMRQRLN